MGSSTPTQTQREAHIVSAKTPLHVRGAHWHSECPSLLSLVIKLWPAASCGKVLILQIIVHHEEQSWQNSSRNFEVASWAGSRMLLTVLLCGSLSLFFFIQSRIVCMGYHPPWAGPTHHIKLLIDKIPPQAYIQDSLMEVFFLSWRSLFSDESSLCQVDKNLTSTIYPLSTWHTDILLLNHNFSCFFPRSCVNITV